MNTLNTALRSTGEAAIRDHNQRRKALRAGDYEQYRASDESKALRAASEVIIGRVTVIANIAGNTVREHVRHTFKIDGKRASRADAERALI